MKLMPAISLALAIATFGLPAWATQQDQHAGHHPAAVAPASTPAPASAENTAAPERSNTDMMRMDAQMKTMRAMHDKMMTAKTPEERKALMAEHMKVMQDGMNMMNEMSAGSMGDMTMMEGMSERGMGDMKGNMAAHHQMMEKRMQMMQAMMQMMMDRLPPK